MENTGSSPLDSASAREFNKLFLSLPLTVNRRLIEIAPVVKLRLSYADKQIAKHFKVEVKDSLKLSLQEIHYYFFGWEDDEDTMFGYTVPHQVVKKELILRGLDKTNSRNDSTFFDRASTHIYCPDLQSLEIFGKSMHVEALKRLLNPSLEKLELHVKLTGFQYTTDEVLELLEMVPNIETFIFHPGFSENAVDEELIDQWKKDKKIGKFDCVFC